MMPIDVVIRAFDDGETLGIEACFSNRSSDEVFLDKLLLMPGGKLPLSVLRLKNENGEDLDYLGPMTSKRAAAVFPEDYRKLLPGEEVFCRINISDKFVLPRRESFTVVYEAFNHDPSTDNDFTLKSNTLELNRE